MFLLVQIFSGFIPRDVKINGNKLTKLGDAIASHLKNNHPLNWLADAITFKNIEIL